MCKISPTTFVLVITLFSLGLLAQLATAAPGPASAFWADTPLDPHWQGELICETTEGSPPTDDVLNAAKKIEVTPETQTMLGGSDMITRKRCFQQNGVGSFCTTLVKDNGAAVAICGDLGRSVLCEDVVWIAAEQIAKSCEEGGKAGGQWLFRSHAPGPKEARVVVFASDHA